MMAFPSSNLRRLMIALATVAALFCAWYAPIQERADAQVDAGLKRALISFASARTLNAIISVVQGTEMSVQPFGVGLTLTPGQVLDPINDLLEQFSSLMLVASVAFGIQKILLAVGGHFAVSAVVSAVLILWAWLALSDRSVTWVSRLVLVLLMIRFAVPLVTLGSDLIFQKVLAQQYQQQQSSLDLAARDVASRVPQPPAPAGDAPSSLLDKLRSAVKDQVKDLPSLPSVNFEAIKKSVEQIPERIVSLIGIFLAQTIIIPIILLWALYRLSFGLLLAGPATGTRR